MTFHLQVRHDAELDLAEAKVWYETQRPGLGSQLEAEISQVFSLLEKTPFIYPVIIEMSDERSFTVSISNLVSNNWRASHRFGLFARKEES